MVVSEVAFFLSLLYLVPRCKAVAGVCQQNYTVINDVRRSTANVYNRTRGDQLMCDRYVITDGTWYRFHSLAGNEMPETRPGFYRCGTYAPIWLNGKHPTVKDGVVSRQACVNLPHVRPSGCGVSYTIKVVNCDGFYLYELKEPDQCYFAYCAGSKLPRNCSTTGDTIPVCPGVVPKVTSVDAGVKDEPGDVKLKCAWTYQGNPNVEFHVQWFAHEDDANHKIEQTFTDGTAREFLFKWEKPDLWGKPMNVNGYKLGKQVYCRIRARYKKGDWSKWLISNKLYTGITVYPQFITMNECTNEKREAIVTLRPHIPIRGKLRVELSYPKANSEISGICVRGGRTSRSPCGITFINHAQGVPMRFKLMTTCLRQNMQDQKVTTQLLSYRINIVRGFGHSFWNSFNFPTIKILKINNDKRTCYSAGDPHFKTLDGRTYDFMGRGTFVLYRNEKFGTEIQTRQKACSSRSSPSCNCGVAIKEKAFYRIYDLCTEDGSTAWWHGDQIIKIRKKFLRDHTLNRFFTNTKMGTSKTDYEVNLPSGVVVTIQRMMWGLNTYVRAPVDLMNPSKGLCGNNNGNPRDDLNGKSPNEFGESWRVPGDHTNLFNYKGDKVEEGKIDDRCGEQICLCQTTAAGRKQECGTTRAVEQCFPQQDPTNLRQNSGIGRCKNDRRKRSLNLNDDDTVDDQDDIPAFNPPKTNTTFVARWPTPMKGLTRENVTDFCSKKLRYSKAGETCGKITGVDIDALVDQCVADIQMTEDFKWSSGNFAALEAVCKTNIFKNASLYKNTTDGELALPMELLTSLCPNDCSGHGTCANSTCTCDEDYTSDDCSLSLEDSPVLTGIRKSGLCDRRRRPCRNVGIYGYPFMDSGNLTCHVREYKVIDSAWIPKNSISYHPGSLVDLTEVKCLLPASPVNIGDYDNEGVTAAGLKIAVSNNRINASTTTMLFITYDSVCQECNTTTGCTLKTDACFIFGHCFAQNQSRPRNWCQQCLPEISTRSWTKRQDNQAPFFQTSKVLYAFYGKALRVQLQASDPENRWFKFSFARNTTVATSLTESGLFTWTPFSNSSTSFLFKVQDECGAHSVLNTTVSIKQCPCQNDGTCQPDYRYLDGAGNFTCICKPGYNGTLCELDVDECLSSPCNNGTCINQVPAFLCSCDPGYTGALCQTEIDECSSSPCFLGVSCHDMVNGYRCGVCPDGYTGTGETCSRIDGTTDECVKSPHVCDKHAKCAYNNGSYTCQCMNGFSGDGKNCSDINECTGAASACHQHADCTNTEGSYYCQCSTGYTGDGKTNCTDINECAGSSVICHQQANCSNTQGSYSCQCTPGYTGDGKVNCTDIDECAQISSVLPADGSGDGNTNCTDIGECGTSSPSPCHEHANCINDAGSFSCQCNTGYSGDGRNRCSDIDECSQVPRVCHEQAYCVNANGSYSCQCATGYSGDGKVNCTDIDECSQVPRVCHEHANCVNTNGSYSCPCVTGYSGDGKLNCSDVDECVENTDVCHEQANCTNDQGSYSCHCKEGYLGDGKHSCTENLAPNFTIPSKVYAILNNVFRIQIKAEDPEAHTMNYSLLSSGTIKNARLSSAGLLSIPVVEKSGNVRIKVQDEVGSQTILDLQIIAMKCPCRRGGQCFLSKSSVYPESAADYECKCEAPYTGALCETGPDPCLEFPCFAGVKCSSSDSTDGYECEKCPELFEGDGKQCKLKITSETSVTKSQMTLTNQEWDDRLTDKTSKSYKKLASEVTKEVNNVYKSHAKFSYVIIKGFSQGSVVVEFELIFTSKMDDPLQPLREATKTGKLGDMQVKMKNPDKPGQVKDEKIAGLDRSVFLVVVIAGSLLVVFVSLVICYRVNTRRTRREAKLRRKANLGRDTAGSQPKGLLYHVSTDHADEAQEMGMAVFNEASVQQEDLKAFENDVVTLDEEEMKTYS